MCLHWAFDEGRLRTVKGWLKTKAKVHEAALESPLTRAAFALHRNSTVSARASDLPDQ